MHELARFHYNRRRRAPEVFDFDRASVQLLAFFKVRRADASGQRLARFRPGFGAIVQAPETADPFNAQREKVF